MPGLPPLADGRVRTAELLPLPAAHARGAAPL